MNNEIPKGWRENKFSDIFIRINGKKYQIKRTDYQNNGLLPVVDQGQKYVVAYSDVKEKKFNGSKGIIVFGDHTRIIKYIDFDFVIGADGTQLLDVKDIFNKKFMYYSLLNKKITNLGYSRHMKLVQRLTFLVPSINEQNKIAEILTNVDNAIDETNNIIKESEKIKKGLMQNIFTVGVNSEYAKHKKVSILAVGYDIPEKWNLVEMKSILDLLKDGTHNPPPIKEEGIPLLSVMNINEGNIKFNEVINYIDEDGYDEIHKKYEIQNDDILLTIVGSLGRTAIVNTNQKFSCQRSIAILRPNNQVDTKYLNYFLQSEIFQKQLMRRANVTAQAGVYLAELGKMKIILPDTLEVQKEIAQSFSSLDTRIKSEKGKKKKLSKLKKGLMQKLLTGQIRVKVD